jgi:2-hydroxychromene-2-carboxylate isomerase
LPKRAPQRQAYRLQELRRYSEFLQIPLHPQPQYFPVAGDDAACLIIATDQHDGTEVAMKLTGAILAAVWAQERNIADRTVLAELLAECGLDAKRLAQADSQEVRERYEACTQQAIAAGVFGAPSYVIDGEIFWGQDRLDFVARKLGVQMP